MPTVFFPEGDLPATSRRVFEALGDLAAEVPIDQWCLISGLMVEVRVPSFTGALDAKTTAWRERTTGIELASSAWKWHEADSAGGAVTCRNVL